MAGAAGGRDGVEIGATTGAARRGDGGAAGAGDEESARAGEDAETIGAAGG